MGLGQRGPERGPVVLADHEHPLGAQAALQQADQLRGVGQRLCLAHGRAAEGLPERFALPAPVPLDHYEILLQPRLEAMGEPHQRRARLAVQEQDEGLESVSAADQNPLPCAAEHDRLQRSDGPGSRDGRRKRGSQPGGAGDQPEDCQGNRQQA